MAEETVEGRGRGIRPVVWIVAAIAAIGVLALVAVAVMNRGGQNVTVAPAPMPMPPQSMVTAPPPPPGQSTPSAPVPPGQAKPSPEMLAYLEFVRGIEEHRQKLLSDTAGAYALAAQGQTQGLLNMIDFAMDPEGAKAQDPLKETKDELIRQYKNWLNLLAYFDKRPAPAECREFSGAYRAVIYAETKAIGDVATSFYKVDIAKSQDLGKLLADLQKMKADPSIQRNIDQTADDADSKLGRLASTYGIRKPFNVPREGKGGSILQF